MSDTFNQLEAFVRTWAEARNIVKGSTADKQLEKTATEMIELAIAIGAKDKSKQIDGIGDVLVTLIIVAEQLGLTLTECLAVAYMEIKDRKGRLVNGTFIKEIENE